MKYLFYQWGNWGSWRGNHFHKGQISPSLSAYTHFDSNWCPSSDALFCSPGSPSDQSICKVPSHCWREITFPSVSYWNSSSSTACMCGKKWAGRCLPGWIMHQLLKQWITDGAPKAVCLVADIARKKWMILDQERRGATHASFCELSEQKSDKIAPLVLWTVSFPPLPAPAPNPPFQLAEGAWTSS